MTTETTRIFYGLDEAAAMIGVSRRTVYSLIEARRLVAVKIASRRLIAKEDLDAFVASVRQPSVAA